MSGIKVVHLTNFDVGIKVHGRHLMLYLRDQGYAVHVVTHPGSYVGADTVIEGDIPVQVLPFPSRITPLVDLATLARLVRWFRRERFDIVHAHAIKPGLLGRLAARIARVPVVVYTIHGFHFHERMRPREIAFYAAIERLGARLSDLVVSQNRADIETAVRMNICPRDKLRHLGNGIDVRVFHPSRGAPDRVRRKKEELGIPPGRKVVCMVGRLVEEKGFREYFEAARLVRERGLDAVFLSIGATHDKKGALDPKALIDRLELHDTLRFLGMRDDVADLMGAMDVLVSASYAEGIPRNVMEACATGKPVVATDVRGTREIVRDGVNGLLVPAQDPVRLADAITRVLSDPAAAAEMGRAGRRMAEETMDERAFFIRTDRWYRELLERHRRDRDWEAALQPIPVR